LEGFREKWIKARFAGIAAVAAVTARVKIIICVVEEICLGKLQCCSIVPVGQKERKETVVMSVGESFRVATRAQSLRCNIVNAGLS
jgi:hypothetical protein